MAEEENAEAQTIPFAGRTVIRARGCWNCIHFENDHLARQKYRALRFIELARLRAKNIPALKRLSHSDREGVLLEVIRLTRAGMPAEEATRQVLGDGALERVEEARFQVFDTMIQKGQIGICLIGKPAGDFVENKYLCADGWSGKQGASVATEGMPLDKTPEELKEILDGPAPKPEIETP